MGIADVNEDLGHAAGRLCTEAMQAGHDPVPSAVDAITGVDFLAAPVDDVARASGEEQEAVLVEPAEVAGAQPRLGVVGHGPLISTWPSTTLSSTPTGWPTETGLRRAGSRGFAVIWLAASVIP